MGLLAFLRRIRSSERILVELVGGPLDGGREEISRSDLEARAQGIIWRAKWRADRYAVYVTRKDSFEWRDDVLWSCYTGRYVGMELKECQR